MALRGCGSAWSLGDFAMRSAKSVVERIIVWTFTLICLFVLFGFAFFAAEVVIRTSFQGWGIEAALGCFTVALCISPILIVSLLLRRILARRDLNETEKA